MPACRLSGIVRPNPHIAPRRPYIAYNMNHVGPNLKKAQVIARAPDSIRGTRQSRECVSLDCFLRIIHFRLCLYLCASNDIYFVMLMDPSMGTVCSNSRPPPALAGPGLLGLGLHSSHSYGYALSSSSASNPPCLAPSSGVLMQYAG